MCALFPLSLSKPEREDEEFLLVAEEEGELDEEAAGEPPSKFALVTFLAALGDTPVWLGSICQSRHEHR